MKRNSQQGVGITALSVEDIAQSIVKLEQLPHSSTGTQDRNVLPLPLRPGQNCLDVPALPGKEGHHAAHILQRTHLRSQLHANLLIRPAREGETQQGKPRPLKEEHAQNASFRADFFRVQIVIVGDSRHLSLGEKRTNPLYFSPDGRRVPALLKHKHQHLGRSLEGGREATSVRTASSFSWE